MDGERAEAPPPVELVAAQRQLDQVVRLLVDWQETAGSDSIALEERRARNYAEACETLEEIFLAAPAQGIELLLTIGREPIRRVRLQKNAYDFLERRSGPELEPGQVIRFRRSQSLENALNRTRTVYATGREGSLEVAGIAETLSQGGKLEIVPTQRK